MTDFEKVCMGVITASVSIVLLALATLIFYKISRGF